MCHTQNTYNFSNSFSVSLLDSNFVNEVSVINRTETALTLQWNNINSNYSYKLTYNDEINSIWINGSDQGSVVTHTASNLTSGTEYIFALYTFFSINQSRGFNFTGVTSKCDLSVKLNSNFNLTLTIFTV